MVSPQGQCQHCQKLQHLLVCSRCKSMGYCSRECQRADWPTHKSYCTQNPQDEMHDAGILFWHQSKDLLARIGRRLWLDHREGNPDLNCVYAEFRMRPWQAGKSRNKLNRLTIQLIVLANEETIITSSDSMSQYIQQAREANGPSCFVSGIIRVFIAIMEDLGDGSLGKSVHMFRDFRGIHKEILPSVESLTAELATAFK